MDESSGSVTAPDLVDPVRALVKERGEKEAAKLLSVGRPAISRLIGGLGVRRGTAALAREGLRKLADANAAGAGAAPAAQEG